MITVKSNHRFKTFEIINGQGFVSFNGVKVPAEDFWTITEEEKEKYPCLKSWVYIYRKPFDPNNEAIVLSTRNDFKEYKIGYIYRNE